MQNIAKDLFQEQIKQLENVKNLIDDKFDNAINILNAAEQIVLTGVGKSGHIAKKINATMLSYGLPTIYLDPVEALHGDLGLVKEGASVILLSKSGTTNELISLYPYLKSRNCKLIGLVGNCKSFLADNSDVFLDLTIDKEACPFNLAPTSSTTVSLVMGDAIAVALVKAKGLRPRDFSINHPSGQLGRNTILKVKDVMTSGEKLPIIDEKANLNDAIIEITKKNLGCVIVNNDKNIGILTDGDIRRILQRKLDINNTIVKDVMTSDPITINENRYLGEALSLMEKRSSQISLLPVLDDNKNLTGLIRIHDIYGSEVL
jgi:arabinose-5-phosphate isomerase